jgi:signal transduction histidine kinase
VLSEAVPAESDSRLELLLRAALELAAEHELDQVLDRVVRSAATVANARYAALGIYDAEGRIERFIHCGLDEGTAARIGDLPRGHGLLGEVIVANGPMRLADLGSDRRSCGFPPHHPPMRTFLGVPVRVAGRRYGNLYLTEKDGGQEFGPEDEQLVVTLAAFAACAIEATQLVAAERGRATALTALVAAEERTRAQREVLARVIDAQEAERARVSRDLHDQIGQALTSVLLGLRLVDGSTSRGEEGPDAIGERLTEVRELVASALDEVRQLAFELRPTVLDDVGLAAALKRLTGDLGRRCDVPFEVRFDGLDDDRRLPPDIETVVYRVVQEALTNIARHAGATTASLQITVSRGGLHATVADDGVGFVVPDAERSLGLAGMGERASLVGGQVTVTSAPGRGTTVALDVPL